jgi:hypothetical protein
VKMLKDWATGHPRLAACLLLSVAMLIVLFVTSGQLSFQPLQRVAMACAVVVLAGLCTWIIYWE